MKTERNVPFKNYVILAIVLILSILGVIYFYMWYGEVQDNIIYTPVMDQYLNVINYNELDTYLVENKDVVIYISILEDAETRKFEKNFKKIIEQYSLNNSILYLDLTNEYKDDNLFNKIKSKYSLHDIPCVVIFRDGNVNDVYSIKDRNYDIDLLVSYLKIEGVIDD